MKDNTTISVNDIVQITDEAHAWFPALLVVTELKPWGVQAYALMIGSNERQDNGQAFNRLKWDEIERVGKAVIA